jgi:hypothetical protein
MAVFWDVAPYSLVHIEEELTASIIRAIMEAVSTSETSVSMY